MNLHSSQHRLPRRCQHHKRVIRSLCNFREDCGDGSGNNSSIGVSFRTTSNRERLATPRLTVSKHRSVESLQRSVYHLRGNIFKYLRTTCGGAGDSSTHGVLRRVAIEDAIECESVTVALVVDVSGIGMSGDEKLRAIDPVALSLGMRNSTVLESISICALCDTRRLGRALRKI